MHQATSTKHSFIAHQNTSIESYYLIGEILYH